MNKVVESFFSRIQTKGSCPTVDTVAYHKHDLDHPIDCEVGLSSRELGGRRFLLLNRTLESILDESPDSTPLLAPEI